jgi:hypothetical protein
MDKCVWDIGGVMTAGQNWSIFRESYCSDTTCASKSDLSLKLESLQ